MAMLNTQRLFSRKILAYLGSLAFVLIWSGWIVLSRHGAQSSLSAVDLSFIRFTTALLFSVPLWYIYRWPSIPWYRIVLVGWGTGAVYTTLSFLALASAKAASGGVLVNGLLPLFGGIIGYLWNRQLLSKVSVCCILVIVFADMLLVGADWQHFSDNNGIESLLLFIGASITFSFYVVAVKNWDFQLLDIVVWVPIVNFLSILPFWLYFDSGIAVASITEVLFQAAYQGILVTLIAGFLVAFTIRNLGPSVTTMFMAFVPAFTAFMGTVFLNEQLNAIELAGIMLCTIALFANTKWGSPRTKTL